MPAADIHVSRAALNPSGRSLRLEYKMPASVKMAPRTLMCFLISDPTHKIVREWTVKNPKPSGALTLEWEAKEDLEIERGGAFRVALYAIDRRNRDHVGGIEIQEQLEASTR